jgi:hypothetical protein
MMLEHLVMTIQFVLVLEWGSKNDGAGRILMMQMLGWEPQYHYFWLVSIVSLLMY